MKRLILFSIFLIGGLFIFFYYKEGNLPVDPKNKQSKIFVVRKGENVTEIAKNLEKEGLIRNRVVFYLIVKKLGIERKLQAGDFRLSPSMSAEEIAKKLTHGTLDVWITIIEGLRKEEVAQIFARELNLPASEFMKMAKEGYLFPDTYLIPKNATINTVLSILANNFEKKYDEKLRQRAKQLGLTDDEVIIIASLIEREAKFFEDRKKVASVIFNRLKADMKLDIDATVQYALGYDHQEKTWWRKNLSLEDLSFDSPYNTYKYKGLPPAPICSPGLDSIKAVLYPEETDYLYYISDKKGKLHFAKTFEEHQRNIKRYLN